MQAIAEKTARIATVAKAAGLNADQMRHLIHGTGGSPRRARRAIKAGVHMQVIDTYTAAFAKHVDHFKAVAECRALFARLMPGAAEADAESVPEEPAAKRKAPAKRKPAAKPVATKVRRTKAGKPKADLTKLRELAGQE